MVRGRFGGGKGPGSKKSPSYLSVPQRSAANTLEVSFSTKASGRERDLERETLRWRRHAQAQAAGEAEEGQETERDPHHPIRARIESGFEKSSHHLSCVGEGTPHPKRTPDGAARFPIGDNLAGLKGLNT
jgi:hypothetical protein